MSKNLLTLAKETLGKIRGPLRRMGYRLEKNDRLALYEPVLYARLRRVGLKDFFFVQIGANDGVMNDPIYQFVTETRVAGVVVEPVRDIYTQLVRNYRHYPRVQPVNLAIHKELKTAQIYRLTPQAADKLGGWAHGIASFQQDHHKLTPAAGESVQAEEVACVSLSELFRQCKVGQVDLLQIDTEGYDSEILKMIPFDEIKPAIIRFEHGLSHGIMSPSVFKEAVDLLTAQGYYIITEPYDAVAYLPHMI
jgi:FkbM family methyltransferase